MTRYLNIFFLLAVLEVIGVCDFSSSFGSTAELNLSRENVLDKKSLQCKQCNILLLNIELLRADYVGLLNPRRISNTPNIDNFFGSSIQFFDVTSPAGETYRSNLAVLTSKGAFNFPATEKEIHKFIHHAKSDRSYRESSDVAKMLLKYATLAEYLKANDFYTISMNQGIRAGKYLLLDRGFDQVINWERRSISYKNTIDALLYQLKVNKIRPYFLLYRPEVLHPMPYYYPDHLDRIEDPKRIIYRHKPDYSRYNIRVNHALSDVEIRLTLHDIYAQQVRLADQRLLKIFKYLETGGQLSNTIVVLYANHGSGLGDNGVEKLAVSYQSSIHVPLLIRHPAINYTVKITTPITLLDLAPTILDLAGITIPNDIDGRSLLRDFDKKREQQRPIVGGNDFDEYIRLGAHKLIRKQGNRLELYYLTDDPGEINNIAGEYPERTRKMDSILDSLKVKILKNE